MEKEKMLQIFCNFVVGKSKLIINSTMEMNKAIEAMIQQAESLNAGKATLEFDYGNGWEVMIAVKKKTDKNKNKKA